MHSSTMDLPCASAFDLPDLDQKQSMQMAVCLLQLLEHVATDAFVNGRRHKLKIDAADELAMHLCKNGFIQDDARRKALEGSCSKYAEEVFWAMLEGCVSDEQQQVLRKELKFQACLPYQKMSCPYAMVLRMVAIKAPAKKSSRQLLMKHVQAMDLAAVWKRLSMCSEPALDSAAEHVLPAAKKRKTA